MGSEMCIRDSSSIDPAAICPSLAPAHVALVIVFAHKKVALTKTQSNTLHAVEQRDASPQWMETRMPLRGSMRSNARSMLAARLLQMLAVRP